MTTCADILAELQTLEDEQIALWLTTEAAVDHLLELINDPPGWVEVDGEQLPTLAELVGRIHNLGAGFSRWRFREQTRTDRTTINLPASCSASLTRAGINGVWLDQTDYSVSGTALTLTDPLEIGDILEVRTYG